MDWIILYPTLMLVLIGAIQGQDWELVFKAVSGVPSPDPYELWLSHEALNEDQPNAYKLTDEFKGHYKSSAVVNWNLLDITEVKVSLYTAGLVVKELEFNGQDTDLTRWFDVSRLLQSSWADLTSATTGFQYFSIEGDDDEFHGHRVERRFFIHGRYTGCANDQGWLVMVPRAPRSATVCAWDVSPTGTYPFFIYSEPATKITWQGGSTVASSGVGYADVFAIFIKHNTPPLSISCLNSCTVDESGGVIYIEVVVGRANIASSRRRRRNSYGDTYTDVMADAVTRRKRDILYYSSTVVRTVKNDPTDSADAIKDYGPIFFETEESLTIPIEIVDDDLVEGDESFTVEIRPLIVNGLSSTEVASVTVTIKDNDVTPVSVVPTPVFTLDKFIYPVKESVGSVIVKVKRTVDTSRQQNIALYLSDIDAITPNDYDGQPTEITLSFDTDEDEKMHSIDIVDDEIVEGPENFEVQLRQPDFGVLGSPYAATVSIKDDDYTHVLASNFFCVNEADGRVRIHVIKRGYLGHKSSVSLRSTAGTASNNQPGNDFNFVATTVEFDVDVSVAYVDINIVKDGVFEQDEQFTVELQSNGPGEEVSEPSTATVIIKSDDHDTPNVVAPQPGPQPISDSSSQLSEGIIAVIAMAVFMTILVSLTFLACWCWIYRRRLLPKRFQKASFFGQNNRGFHVDGSVQTPYSNQNGPIISY